MVVLVDGRIDGVTLYVTPLTPVWVMLMLKTGITVVTTGGKVKVRTVVVEERSFHFSVRVVVTGGKWRVVGVGSVKGGRTMTQGGTHVTVGVGLFQTPGSIKTGGPLPVVLLLTQGKGQYPRWQAKLHRPASSYPLLDPDATTF